ncbi:Receptor protein-tyrosine kinase, partial [Caligus rogercresseyi]
LNSSGNPHLTSRSSNSGGAFISMDNPEYILNSDQKPSRGDYHTLGIPFIPNSPSS